MNISFPLHPYRSRGSALLIVLAFLLLLTTLTVAFLSRATTERQLSNASFSQSKTDMVAQGAASSIIADLQSEIVAGSNGSGTPTVATGYYYPTSPANAVPATSGFTHVTPPTLDGLENLVKISKNGAAFYSGGPQRASPVNTTTTSLNNRSVSVARWNAPLLLSRKNPTSTTDYTPVTAFVAPDWIYIARDGTNPTAWSTGYAYSPNVNPNTTPGTALGTNPVLQRYAYAIYDEGGTLDMNVAGSPMATSGSVAYSASQPFKTALSYADLTQLPYLSSAALLVAGGGGGYSGTLTAAQQRLFNNAIVGWRDYYTADAGSGQFPGTVAAYSFPKQTLGTIASSEYPKTVSMTPYDLFSFFNPTGFLSMGGFLGNSPAINYNQNNNGSNVGNMTDNALGSRQQLIQLFIQGLGQNSSFTSSVPLTSLINVLQYMGTFSRDLSQPSYAPPASRPVVLAQANGGNSAVGNDATVNPNLLSVTITGTTTATRNNGTSFVKGEPLIKKRFALNRLAWITYKGPSATRTMSDLDMVALMAYGIPKTYLLQGTATNIQNYFGLKWDSTNHVWDYNVHNGASGSGTTGAIMQLGAISALSTPHEPDFFEILKGTIGVGSLAKALAFGNAAVPADSGDASSSDQPANYDYYAESSVDYQIIQIGANMIDQFQPANYAVQIVFNDGSGSVYSPRTIVGNENLPYLTAIMNGALQVQQPSPLPRNGTNYNGTPGTGTTGNSGYQSTDTITASGVGAFMQLPIVWNPYDPSSAPGSVSPTNFRVVADSATPDVVVSQTTASYNSYFAYAASLGVSTGSNYSNNMTSTSNNYTYFYDSIGTGKNISHIYQNPSNTTGNEEVDFSVATASGKELLPEPMILMRPTATAIPSPSSTKYVTDNNSNTFNVSVPTTSLLKSDPAVSGLVTNGGLPNYIYNAPQMQSPQALDPVNTSYIGFYLGAFPLAWTDASGVGCSEGQSGSYLARVNGTSGTPAGTGNACYMTYRMQYQDPYNASNWITYDTKYGQVYFGSAISLGVCPNSPPTSNNLSSGALVGAADWAFTTDPRTSRFGIMGNAYNAILASVSAGQGGVLPGPELSFWSSGQTYGAGWMDTANGILYTTRPDGQSGFYCKTGWKSAIGPTSGWMAYIGSDSNNYPGLGPGLLTQNNTDIFYHSHRFYGDEQGALTFTPNYFADPDGMVRRGMGAFVALGSSSSPQATYSPSSDVPPADTTVGLPMARSFNWGGSYTPPQPNVSIVNYTGPTQPTSQAQSRPIFLHRPFYSVAELGYVFSDTPWRNLDFFTAESGNTALLDAFCVNDTSDAGALVAGKVDLNTRQVPVLQAVLAGGCLDQAQVQAAAGANTSGQLDSTTANLAAAALVARTTDTTNLASNGTGPLRNVSELVGKWVNNVAINDLGSLITGTDKGTLPTSSGFYDGKLSYAGFSGGVWDTTHHKPYKNGVENFSSGNPIATPNNNAEDVYSAYASSGSFADNSSQQTYHNGPLEAATSIERFREAPIRALTAAGTTRVWNLMVDVIAQTGRCPASSTGLSQFNVEGERRYWVHVAIDRYTGKVLDEQIEEVKE